MQISPRVIKYREQAPVAKNPCLISYNLLITRVYQDMFHYEYEVGILDEG